MTDLSNYRIIPTIKINDANDSFKLAVALVKGGIPIAEVTFRTAAAADAIREMSRYPGILVGAGSIINVDQAKEALEAGAQFIVSPGFNPELVDFCLENNVTFVPGVATASEIIAAVNKGFTFLKLFPAEQLGGVKGVKALSAPFPQVRFMPTGGVNAANMTDYLSLGCVRAIGGSWMVREDWINNGQFDLIEQECRNCCQLLAK